MKVRSNLYQSTQQLVVSVFALMVICLITNQTIASDLKTELAVAEGDTIVVSSEGANLSYDVTEIRAEAGSTLTIKYVNKGDLPHNVVLVKSRADINPVGIAGLQASKTDYIPQEEALQEKIIAHTALSKPGETVFVTFTVPPPGTYPYICTYAGHFTMMQGDLISE